jgi:hypothetical protein
VCITGNDRELGLLPLRTSLQNKGDFNGALLDFGALNKGRKGESCIQFTDLGELLFEIDEDTRTGNTDVFEGVVPTEFLPEIQAAGSKEVGAVMEELP